MHIVLLGIFFGLLTGVSWGLFPIIAKKIGGTPDHWLFGACLGMGIMAIICFSFIAIVAPYALADFSTLVFILQLLAGIAWSVTMMAQYSLIHLIGAAKGLSMANGGKTVLATIFAVFFLGTWLYNGEKLFGFFLIILIIAGVVLINWRTNENQKIKTELNWYHANKQWIYLLILSVAAIAFSQFPNLLNSLKQDDGGWQYPAWSAVIQFIPQSIGAAIGGVCIVYFRAKFIHHDMSIFSDKRTYLNIYDGMNYGLGMICYLYSVFLLKKETNKLLLGNEGIDAGAGATAFALTNFANIVSALGGIIVLKEKFTKKELIFFIVGALVLSTGAVLITFINNFSFLQCWGKTPPIIKIY